MSDIFRLLEEVAAAPLVLSAPDAEEDDDGDDADDEQHAHDHQREDQLRDVVLVAQLRLMSRRWTRMSTDQKKDKSEIDVRIRVHPRQSAAPPPCLRSGGLLLARLLGRRGR